MSCCRPRGAWIVLGGIALAAVAIFLILDRRATHELSRVEPAFEADHRAATDVIEPAPLEARTVVDAPPAPRLAPIAERAAPPSRPRGRLPDRNEVFVVRVATPPGVIEVVVFEGAGVHPSAGLDEPEVPLARIPIAVYPAESKTPPERPEDVSDPSDWTHTDPRGFVRFEGRAPGVYAIRAWIEDDLVLTGTTELEEAGGRRFVFRVGGGVVLGQVFAPDGAPWRGTRFDLRVTPDAGYGYRVSAQSDAAGRFRFDRLPSSRSLLIQENAVHEHGWRPSRARFALASNETLEIVFGNRTPPVRWTGTLRAVTGEPIETSIRVDLDEANQGREHQFSTDDDGRFRAELPAGEYLVGPEGQWGSEGFLRASVGPRGLEQDLVVPLIAVRLVTPPDEFARFTAFQLVRSDGAGGTIDIGEGTLRSGRLERFGLRVAPARYRLVAKGSGRITGATDEGLELDLSEKTGLVTIEVPLVPR